MADRQSGPFNSPADARGSNPPGEVMPGAPHTVGGTHNPPADIEENREHSSGVKTSEVLAVTQIELDGALGWAGTRVSEARRVGLENYFGSPRGDERQGRSQVVTREVFESVEQAMPDMMEIFTASNEIARFIPKTGEDAEAADQATDAVNHVFTTNDGFMVLYTMFKDAFIQKNGIVKVWWEESNEWQIEEYEGKTLLEFFTALEDEDLLVMEATAYTEGPDGEREEIPMEVLWSPEGLKYDPMGVYFDARCKRMNNNGKVRMDNIPPEEFVINRDARGLNDPTVRFVAHRVRTTESDLVAQGYDPYLVSSIPSSQTPSTTDQDAITRSSQDDNYPQVHAYRSDEQRTVYITECYVKIDQDGDGISEWWKVVVGGDYGQALLSAEQVNYHPFASCTPIPVPHRFYGLSFSDVTDDLQQINTTLWRQYLDSLYLANDPRTIILSSGRDETATPLANLSQLLNSEVGGYVEEYEPGAIRPFPIVDNAQHILPAFELHEQALQSRLGISPDAMGVNPDAISKHVFGAMVQTSASARRLAMYARIFANTGVQRIFELIYKELSTHQMAPMMLRLRGEWVPIDPSDWATNMDCQVNVGLGHGSRMEKAGHSQTLLEVQRQVAEAGLTNIVDHDNIYNSCSTLTENLGFKDVDKYFNDPSNSEPPEDEPTPEEKAIEAQQQIDMMKVELERQKLEIDRDRVQLEAKKIELDHEAKIYELRIKAQTGTADAKIKAGGDGTLATMDDPAFNIMPPPPPPPMPPPMPMGPPPQPAGGLATIEQAGMTPSPEEQAMMQQAFTNRERR